MAECRYYRVAEHVFSITANEEQLSSLLNYAPFQCEPYSSLLFALQLAPVSAAHLTHVFTESAQEDMPRIEIYRQNQNWLFQISLLRSTPVALRLLCSPDFSRVTLDILNPSDFRFAVDNATMLAFAFASAPFSTLEMHASVVVKDQKAHLFLGPSGTGKSTHSRQWLSAFSDAYLLNDDNPVVRVLPSPDGDKVMCFGSPWSGKTPCYKNASFPVAAFVQLSQSPTNEMQQLSLPESYALIVSSSSGLKIVPEMMDAIYSSIIRVLNLAPCYLLRCLPNTASAELCYTTIHQQ